MTVKLMAMKFSRKQQKIFVTKLINGLMSKNKEKLVLNSYLMRYLNKKKEF